MLAKICQIKDDMRDSQTKISNMLFKRRKLDPSSSEWKNIEKLINHESFIQKDRSYTIAIFDSIIRANNYKKEMEKVPHRSEKWKELLILVNAEFDMQNRLKLNITQNKRDADQYHKKTTDYANNIN